MYMVALTNLMMAMRIQTVSRGWDPRDFAIVPYGGGGAMYACDLAREIGSSTVVIPPLPGYASAFGAIRVDVKHEFTKAIHKTEQELDFKLLNKQINELEKKAAVVLKGEGMQPGQIVIQRFVDIKYFSQSRFFTVEAPAGAINDLDAVTKNFLTAMQVAYGYTLPPGYTPIELVNLRVVAKGEIPKPSLPKKQLGGTLADAVKGHRRVWYKDGGFVNAAIYERDRLPVGATFDGPAVVEQPDTTSVLPPGTHCRVDEYNNLIIQVDR
jgi:N-methylhydantoinase A